MTYIYTIVIKPFAQGIQMLVEADFVQDSSLWLFLLIQHFPSFIGSDDIDNNYKNNRITFSPLRHATVKIRGWQVALIGAGDKLLIVGIIDDLTPESMMFILIWIANSVIYAIKRFRHVNIT